ncbi:hypothetical protein [Legionella jordanis]|uniref:Membrane protein n=1 Tax=Legionella jordanis TaxID=456 RepID=A0A0W0V8E5_9GAMM|nr:hypothetical protein [Legionella jordanis]KTD16403.1 membrane protein [Legionella jordanis]RMX04394.1 hypothetical protein EAW55_02860 [Legionella jordanis]VEH12136.1 membrane protein [Legionella jordanis]
MTEKLDMILSKFKGKRDQIIIPLQVKPYAHQGIPSITGSAISHQAGTVLYGYYNMDYKLPNGDYLRIIANHDRKSIQILLLTRDAKKLEMLPGKRQASLIANCIDKINHYRIRSNHYAQPRSIIQKAKYQLATSCITQLQILLDEERRIQAEDWAAQEALRVKVISILENYRGQNLLLSTQPLVSEGALDSILYETKQMAQHYQFNRLYPVCRIDQLDFSEHTNPGTIFVWDSDLHIGQDEQELNDAIRVICQHYQLSASPSLSHIAANRFERLKLFLLKLWLDGRDWIDHLKSPHKGSQITETETRADGLCITRIKPYYSLAGAPQNGYASVEELVSAYSQSKSQYSTGANSFEEALPWLSRHPNGSWVKLGNQEVLLRLNNEILSIRYFIEQELCYPLPCGEDLYQLSQLAKHHLYLPERASLQLRAFFSRLPIFFKYLFKRIHQFSIDLYQEFLTYIHENHKTVEKSEQTKASQHLSYLQKALYEDGLLNTGQTLEEFVQFQLRKNHYMIVRETHPPCAPPYENPLHRILEVLRHVAGFFVDTSEKNPILGTLAMAAYAYGAGAVIAPETLTAILSKLHMNGLIYGIKPTQALAKWMSHGKNSEAISAAMTYWQAIVVGGDLDQFFIKAIAVLKEEPAEVAIIVALAIALGYGICKSLPSLQEEMGEFPYINYAALGAKGGAAIFDTVMHPGNDWLLGTIKWFLQVVLTLVKLTVGPFAEFYYYGYNNGFVPGLRKSWNLWVNSIKGATAAAADLLLSLTTIPLLELSSLLIHVPFRGLTKLLSKTFVVLGNWQVVGSMLIQFATRPNGWGRLPHFRLSPLYGFSSPFYPYAEQPLLNLGLNLIMLFIWPPFLLLKNFTLLPALDLLSFGLRLTIMLLDPLTRGLAYACGVALNGLGAVWDNSLGHFFQRSAYGIIYLSNKIDNFTGLLKQRILASIQIHRRKLYHWAFSAGENARLPKCNTDVDYCLENPMRIERLPHSSTNCVLQSLLSPPNSSSVSLAENPRHSRLFHAGTIPNTLQMPSQPSPLTIQ